MTDHSQSTWEKKKEKGGKKKGKNREEIFFLIFVNLLPNNKSEELLRFARSQCDSDLKEGGGEKGGDLCSGGNYPELIALPQLLLSPPIPHH